jgi:hypothetical protein
MTGSETTVEPNGDVEDVSDDELRDQLSQLSGLNRMPAPPDFTKGLEKTIERRSAGRFFGRKAFGDRVPFEWLAVVALVLGLVIFGLIRYSSTGSLKVDQDPGAPTMHPEARDVVPTPPGAGK